MDSQLPQDLKALVEMGMEFEIIDWDEKNKECIYENGTLFTLRGNKRVFLLPSVKWIDNKIVEICVKGYMELIIFVLDRSGNRDGSNILYKYVIQENIPLDASSPHCKVWSSNKKHFDASVSLLRKLMEV